MLQLRDDAGGVIETLSGSFDQETIDLFRKFVAAMRRVRTSDLLVRGLSSPELKIRDGVMQIICPPYTDNEMSGLLHVLRAVMLSEEATSFERIQSIIGKGFRSRVLASFLRDLRRQFDKSNLGMYMQLSIDGRNLFDESVVKDWLYGTQYHTDSERAAAWQKIEAMISEPNARALMMGYVFSRVEALFRLESYVSAILEKSVNASSSSSNP
jgi:hypothetical protein